VVSDPPYRGRLAPSPTGYPHLGHARTFWTAQKRAQAAGGALVLRNEDLDAARIRADFTAAMLEDLRWFGLIWQEGPDVGGPYGPYNQSERSTHYVAAIEQLRASGSVYPCRCSRRDVHEAAGAPHEAPPGEAWEPDEPLYPGTCRPPLRDGLAPEASSAATFHRENTQWRRLSSGDATPSSRTALENATEASRLHEISVLEPRLGTNWRFRVPDGTVLAFTDGRYGPQTATAGVHFGDFIVWRKDDLPAYQLACVVDDAAMRITEVVRGADLLLSTFRQLLLYRALGLTPPAFCHCPLVTDEHGVRLAKRHDPLSLRAMRAHGRLPDEIRQEF
jgi:glutamyl-tRNA synthetase